MHDVREFVEQFQDFLAPKLDIYEQAIYLYIYRHSRLVGVDEVVIAFKSSRVRMACGIGKAGTPMSEGQAYEKLASLEKKRCLRVLQTEHKGRRMRLYLPKEIEGVVVTNRASPENFDLEAADFFDSEMNRLAILKREKFRCFYTLKKIDENSFVAEHVVSRPAGDNGYRNIVAASREANNKKGSLSAEDFLRALFRDGILSEIDLAERMKALIDLKSGNLKPEFD